MLHIFKRKKIRRSAAFLLAVAMMTANINISDARAEVLEADEAGDIVTIDHVLSGDGRTAAITVSEARPDIMITDVKMVRGKTAEGTAATPSTAKPEDQNPSATESEAERPLATDSNGGKTEATESNAGRNEADDSESDTQESPSDGKATGSEAESVKDGTESGEKADKEENLAAEKESENGNTASREENGSSAAAGNTPESETAAETKKPADEEEKSTAVSGAESAEGEADNRKEEASPKAEISIKERILVKSSNVMEEPEEGAAKTSDQNHEEVTGEEIVSGAESVTGEKTVTDEENVTVEETVTDEENVSNAQTVTKEEIVSDVESVTDAENVSDKEIVSDEESLQEELRKPFISEATAGKATDNEALDAEPEKRPEVSGEWTMAGEPVKYSFVVDKNRIYRFRITYETEEEGEPVKQTISVNYKVEDIGGITFLGTEDLEIPPEVSIDLMDQVSALDDSGNPVDEVMVRDDGGFQNHIPGTYRVLYAAVHPETGTELTKEREIKVGENAALTMVSNIHGQEEGKTLAIPVNRNVEGILTLNYRLPDQTGRTLDITFPKYVRVVTYPTDSPFRNCTVTKKDEQYILHMEILDDVKNSINFQVAYASEIHYSSTQGRLSLKDKQEYVKTGEVSLDSFHAAASGSAEARIGPMITLKNTEESTGGRVLNKIATNLGEKPIQLEAEFYKIEEGRFLLFRGSGTSYWTVESPDGLYGGNIPVAPVRVKVYAPENFQFSTEGLTDADNFITLGTEGNHGYLIYDFSKRNEFANDMKKVTAKLIPGSTVTVGKSYTARSGEYTYRVYGEEKTDKVQPMYTMSIINKVQVEDLLKLETHSNNTLWLAGTAGPPGGTSSDLISISNYGNNWTSLQQIPSHRAEGLTVTLTFPDEIINGSGDRKKLWKLDTGSPKFSSNGGNPVSEIDRIELLLSDGSKTEAFVIKSNYSSSATSENLFNYTIGLPEEVPEDVTVKSMTITYKQLYQAKHTLRFYQGARMAKTQADGTEFPYDESSPGVKVAIDVSMEYEGKIWNSSCNWRVTGVRNADLLEIVSNGKGNVTPGRSWSASGMIIRNMPRKEVNDHYSIPTHHAEGAVVTVEYPDGIRPDSWQFNLYQSDLNWNVMPSTAVREADIESVILYLNDGRQLEAKLTKTSSSGAEAHSFSVTADIPKDTYVIKLEARLRKLYGVGYNLSHSGVMALTDKDGNAFAAGVITADYYLDYDNVRRESKQSFTVNPAPRLVLNAYYRTSGSYTSGLITGPVTGKLVVVAASRNTVSVNPRIELTGKDLVNYFTGEVGRYVKLKGWTITWETSFGRNGSYEIPMEGNRIVKFVDLEPGEHLTRVVLSRDGYTDITDEHDDFYYDRYSSYNTWKYGITFGVSIPYEEARAMPRDPGNPDYAVSAGEWTYSDTFAQPVSGKAAERWKVEEQLPIGGGTYTAAVQPQQIMQGNDFTLKMELYNYLERTNNYGRNLPVGNLHYYVEWRAATDIILKGALVNGEAFDGDVVTTEDGSRWLKLTPRHTDFIWKTMSTGGPASKRYLYSELTLQLSALPGAREGITQLTGDKVYVDMKPYMGYADYLKDRYGAVPSLHEAIADAQGICQDGDRDMKRLLEVTGNVQNTEVLLKNITGVSTMLGVGSSYENNKKTFTPSQRKRLKALFTASTGVDTLKNYEIKVRIPKKGEMVSYQDEGGNIASKESEFDLILQGPASVAGSAETAELTYRLNGQTGFVQGGEVVRWSDVAEVKLLLGTLPAKGSSSMILDLEAEEKNVSDILNAYLAPQYSYVSSGGSQSAERPGPLSTFTYGNYQISGRVWNDSNENGVRENGESVMDGVTMGLYKGSQLLMEAVTDKNGSYELNTHFSDDLNVRITMPSQTVLTTAYAAEATASTDSDFDRTTKTSQISGSVTAAVENVDAGIVYLPVLEAEDVKVKKGKTAQVQAKVTVRSGSKPRIRYKNAVDENVAMVSEDGVVTGKESGKVTQAEVWVQNSLGDRVTKTYQIRVGTNSSPMIKAHDWTVIQGDSVVDWWADVECTDPEDTFPARLLKLLTGEKLTKDVKFYSALPVSDDLEITEEEALASPGIRYVRYLAIDEDGNEGSATKILTVHGRLKSSGKPEIHTYAQNTELKPEIRNFYYNLADGTRVVLEEQSDPINRNTAGAYDITFRAVHPKTNEVTKDVTAGDGRSLEEMGSVYVDSVPVITGLTDREISPGETVAGLMEGAEAEYTHYEEGKREVRKAGLTLTAPDGTVISDGTYTASYDPGVYTLKVTAQAAETYEAGENKAEAEIHIYVKGKIDIEAPKQIYMVSGDVKDEGKVRQKIGAKGYYNNPVSGGKIELTEQQMIYQYHKSTEGAVISVDIHGEYYTGMTTVISDPVTVMVIAREIPKLTAGDVHMRTGESFDPQAGVTMDIQDEHNQWSVTRNMVNTTLIGKYDVTYQAVDTLTGAASTLVRAVYVHGLPQISMENQILYTHQSTGPEVLIETVRIGQGTQIGQSATAWVTYVEHDGAARQVNITKEVQFAVADSPAYYPQKPGVYKVTAQVDDRSIAPAELAAASASASVNVTVSDRIYQAEFTVNSADKGTYGSEDSYTLSVVHGELLKGVRTPVPAERYRFMGYRLKAGLPVSEEVRLPDGTVIAPGQKLPAGTLLPEETLKSMKMISDASLEAYFAAPPQITAVNVKLYESEVYSQAMLNVRLEDPDDPGLTAVVDDGHVDTNKAGTYQVKISATDKDGNTAVVYAYVQVWGKTEISIQGALNTRKDTRLTRDDVLGGVTAVYGKPPEIPQTPWEDSQNKTEAVETPITNLISVSIPGTDTMGRTEITVRAPGMLEGREDEGADDENRTVYIHGNPVIVAYDNTMYTHQAVSAQALEETIKTGVGNLTNQPAGAYVEYVQHDGSIERKTIDPSLITYRTLNFVKEREGTYRVELTVDDSTTAGTADVPGIVPAQIHSFQNVVVADKIFIVTFEAEEHGSYVGGDQIQVPVAYGKPVTPPQIKPDEGYRLSGWVSGDGTAIANISTYRIYSDQTIKARFVIREYLVRFIGKRDRVIKSQIVKHGMAAEPPTEDRDLKLLSFEGWSGNYTNVKYDSDIYARFAKKYPTGPGRPNKDTDKGPGVGKDHPDDTGAAGDPQEALIPESPVRTEILDSDTPLRGFQKKEKSSVPENILHDKVPAAQTGETDQQPAEKQVIPEQKVPTAVRPSGAVAATAKKCVIHWLLLLIGLAEAVYLLTRKKKDEKDDQGE